MTRNSLTAGIVVGLILLGLLASGALFTVTETQQALVLQFGEHIRTIREPGLNAKIPLVQNVVYMEKRILDFDAPPVEAISKDKKRLVVDAYARFRISDPLLFYQAVRADENSARSRLGNFVNSSLRAVLGQELFRSMLSGDRPVLMRTISDRVNVEAKKLGMEIVDVRIKRADLPEKNSQSVYQRMRAEREREAKLFRAEGDELSQKIRANAERERTIMLAEAQKKSEILRGQGDALRNRTFAVAYEKDTEFFSFYRSLLAYRKALSSDDTTMVLTPDSEFFRYFGNMNGAAKSGAGKAAK